MIYDVILILIFILFILIYAYLGAARALAGILSSIAAYFAAGYLGRLISPLIYDGTIKPAVDKAVIDALNKAASGSSAAVAGSVPSWLASLLKSSGTDVSGLIKTGLSGSADSVCSAVNTAIRPVAVSVMTVLITILLFIIILILLRLLVVKPVLGLFELPVINVFNRILGGFIGFVAAFLAVSLLAYLLKLLIPGISSNSGILNESTIYNSFIFYHFYSGNIFTVLLSFIGL